MDMEAYRKWYFRESILKILRQKVKELGNDEKNDNKGGEIN
ncbi:Uncharacterised protein [Metamycoplasma arthritidis]|uniref:Uncharacterized protein n=1 Tax=Metamycoplasma arthritidis (strain 158L3-1) TaxID=243272 RepID=B3PMB7_META1|nr:hypothetical protein [Metamycoplasma arthritidis]ACF07169.1 hypothetical protein MARTH_orf265 [Metamycoplasma arthritidis 158L3-1]VEU78693.1 Uncharacterised protein [Metamycoplasma arthritidis]